MATSSREAIENVQNQALRTISGCTKSTPITSLKVLTGVSPLQLRDNYNSVTWLGKAAADPLHPLHDRATAALSDEPLAGRAVKNRTGSKKHMTLKSVGGMYR